MSSASLPPEKATLEFTSLETFPFTPAGEARQRILSQDQAGNMTVVLYHPPGQSWGGSSGPNSQAEHDYWEEVLILKGALHDLTLDKTFGPNHYCCRPPGMRHGPWQADTKEGCEEIVWIRRP